MNTYALKHILIIFFIVSEIKCHVTVRSKYSDFDEVTTQIPVENETKKDVKDSEQNHSGIAVNKESRVYLDDVLFNLKSQVWDAEEQPCLDHIYRLLYNLQNFTLWAVWDWDSQSSEPQGLLFGNKYQLGNFDQCMNAPWFKTHPELRTKYCLAEITLERTDKAIRRRIARPQNPYQSALDYIEHRPPYFRPINELVWGACVPTSCAPRTVERLLGVMLARSHLGAAGMHTNISITEPCQDSIKQREYDGMFYGFVGLAVLLTLISLICTYLNCQKKELSPDTRGTDFIQAFCLRENAADLLRMKKEGIEVFYGIRFLTICLIVLDHQIGISNAGPVSDGLLSDQKIRSPVGLLIIHDDLFVDTFFLLSGFLTITTLDKFKRLPNPILIIFKRYVRLVVALAVLVFYVSAVFPHTGTGPLWNNAVAHETALCRENWWINLLMLNNYVNSENMCIIATWYIPCDFHCFSVTILIYCLYKRHPRLGKLFAAVFAAGSILIPGIINYVYQLPAVQLFTYEFVVNPRGSKEFLMTYITSHTRYAAYLVGVFSGYLFVTYSANGNLNRIKQRWSIIGSLAALAIMLAVMLYGSTFLSRSYHPLEGALYAALNRPAWAAGVGLLVLCCSLGHVPMVKSFLSWYPWVPLSRLAYGLYLTHSIIITRNVFVTRNPQHNDYFDILNTTVGVIFWGCVGALFLWLLAEAPANKLIAMCLKSKIPKNILHEKTLPTSGSLTMSTTTVLTDSKGHLHDNLSHNIYYSSKI